MDRVRRLGYGWRDTQNVDRGDGLANVLILISIVAAIVFAGLADRHGAAVRKALQPFLPIELRGLRLTRLDNWVWNPLVPVQAKWNYVLCVIYGCVGGALLTLAFVVGRWDGPALFTGICTAAGIIQATVSSVKYRRAAAFASAKGDSPQ